jgi:hypothetical protein
MLSAILAPWVLSKDLFKVLSRSGPTNAIALMGCSMLDEPSRRNRHRAPTDAAERLRNETQCAELQWNAEANAESQNPDARG